MFDSLFFKRFANRYKQNVQSSQSIFVVLLSVWLPGLLLKMTLFELATFYNFEKGLFIVVLNLIIHFMFRF